MLPAELEADLHGNIPLTQAMQVRVLEIGPDSVRLGAPLSANINHHRTAFGGSLATLATLAAWSLPFSSSRPQGLTAAWSSAPSIWIIWRRWRVISQLVPFWRNPKSGSMCWRPSRARARHAFRSLPRSTMAVAVRPVSRVISRRWPAEAGLSAASRQLVLTARKAEGCTEICPMNGRSCARMTK